MLFQSVRAHFRRGLRPSNRRQDRPTAQHHLLLPPQLLVPNWGAFQQARLHRHFPQELQANRVVGVPRHQNEFFPHYGDAELQPAEPFVGAEERAFDVGAFQNNG